LLKKNWRCPAGEIDLIVQTPGSKTHILVEVKARSFEGTHSVKASVDYAKRAQLYRVAEVYARPLLRSDKESRFRIDTIRIVYLHEHGTLQFRLEHIAAAIHHAFTFEKKSWGQNRPLRQTKALFRKSYSS
jgi:putative endonuclease